MQINRKIIVASFTTLLIASISWWLADSSETLTKDDNLALQDHSIDYYIKNLSVITMGEDGLPSRSLSSELLNHYQDDDTTELSQPRLTVFDADSSPWVIIADEGWISSDASLVLLSGKVNINRQKTPTSPAINIVGSEMRVQPKEFYIETDKEITITSNESHINSVGMHAWFKNPTRFKFLSNVRGYYAAK